MGARAFALAQNLRSAGLVVPTYEDEGRGKDVLSCVVSSTAGAARVEGHWLVEGLGEVEHMGHGRDLARIPLTNVLIE